MANDGHAMDRGSDRIFELSGDNHSELAEALGTARNTYQVKWWWKYGTPVIDYIHGGFQVKPEDIAGTIQQVLRLNSDRLRVNFDVFPIGVVQIDGYQLSMQLRQAGRG